MRVELSQSQLEKLRRGVRVRIAWPLPCDDVADAELPAHAREALGDALHSAIVDVAAEDVRVAWPDGRPVAPANLTELFGPLIRDGKRPRGLSYMIPAVVVELCRDPAAPPAPGVQWVMRVSLDGRNWVPPPDLPADVQPVAGSAS